MRRPNDVAARATLIEKRFHCEREVAAIVKPAKPSQELSKIIDRNRLTHRTTLRVTNKGPSRRTDGLYGLDSGGKLFDKDSR
jgi:hypothetical protein